MDVNQVNMPALIMAISFLMFVMGFAVAVWRHEKAKKRGEVVFPENRTRITIKPETDQNLTGYQEQLADVDKRGSRELQVPITGRPTREKEDDVSWAKRLVEGLTKTREGLTTRLANLFQGGRRLDDHLIEQIHEALYHADLGVQTVDELVGKLNQRLKKIEQDLSWELVRDILFEEVSKILVKGQQLESPLKTRPRVYLIVGVNGVGKTTTVAKLAAQAVENGEKVLLAAADTYRAAAIDQLKAWGERLGVDVIAKQPGADPASVAFDAIKAAKARHVDLLLIDTAGRLHSKKELMDELAKVKRVLAREVPDAPHETWLVVDGTTGQNALQQIRAFKEVVDLTGIIVTKLDGTAKGGVLVAACRQFDLPIRYIGVGEQAQDLQKFDARAYARSLFYADQV